MTHHDAKPEVRPQLILHPVIHALAENPTGQDTILLILQQTISLAFADAGIFVVFDEAQILHSEAVTLDDLTVAEVADDIRSYTDDLYVGTDVPTSFGVEYTGWMLIPIVQNTLTVGALILLYSDTIEIDANINEVLATLVDSLRVVAFVARLKARQIRHNRNQHEFLQIVTHDMRSPLTSMQGFGSMLESQMAGDLNEKQSRFVEKILSGITQLTLQVDNMQDAGRYDPETGFYEMARSPTDLVELVEKIVSSALIPTEKQNLQVKFHSDDMIPIVNVDFAMIDRSIVNLVDNAIKYTPDNGKVDVHVRHIGDNIEISVKDTGFGISQDNIDKLFNRHFRVHRREHKRVKGSGLGLFIVRSVAVKHGGEAWVESIEGQGSTFYIRIPLADKNLIGADSE